MFIGIKELEVRKVRFEETFQPGEIDFSDAGVKQATPLRSEGVAELLAKTDGEIRIKGSLAVRMESECDRCLATAVFPIDTRFDLFYRPAVMTNREDEAIDEGEAEIGFYEGGGLELEDILREQILLLLPMQRVCRPECRGICPMCGADRNESSCDCHAETADDRWISLRTLR